MDNKQQNQDVHNETKKNEILEQDMFFFIVTELHINRKCNVITPTHVSPYKISQET